MNHFLQTVCRCAVLLAFLLQGSTCEAVGDKQVSFSREVKPILTKHCFACHGPDEAESGFALHEREALLAVTDSGEPAIVPGEPDKSEMIRRVTVHDESERMPPEGESLSQREIETLRRWIAEGAEYQKHWAFVSAKPQEQPTVQNKSWVANPIDAFVLAQLEAKQLSPARPADKGVLARRAYYDVTGLPPTPAEVRAFIDDTSPNAYDRLVDRLLASPRYGEKWARHWFDVVRYAESNSFERDAPKPFVWKYRDYVIRSLNADKPYDQFVREQLAGDELDEVTTETITATGYYRLGTWDDEPADPLQSKYDDLDNIVSTTGQAILGLTVGCARCHDHKIDPLPQTDYYGLLAFFADITPYGAPKHHSLWDLSDKRFSVRRQKLEGQQEHLERLKIEVEQAAIARLSDMDQRRTETPERAAVLKEKLPQVATEDELKRLFELGKQLEEIHQKIKELPPAEYVLSLAKCDPHPKQMHVMMRGNAHALGDPVEPCFPTLFGQALPEIPVAAKEARSAGRRRVLAEWLTRDDNMLTSRVIANRVWQHHFGRGIVRSTNNFGQLGTPPTHPRLLDWLAAWLVDHDWRLKPLHRLILTSNTYRMSSAASAEGLAADPANDLFWRFNMRRLTAEEIRDSVLQVSGQLNDKMYGPSIFPTLSPEVLATQSKPGLNWDTSGANEANRRSIYIHIKRSLIPPELANFDFPDTDTSCESRFNTTQAAQALNLLHGDFLQTQAMNFARRVVADVSTDIRRQVAYALQLALQREPDEATIVDGLSLIERFETKYGLSQREAFRQYCLMVFSLNEFVYLD